MLLPTAMSFPVILLICFLMLHEFMIIEATEGFQHRQTTRDGVRDALRKLKNDPDDSQSILYVGIYHTEEGKFTKGEEYAKRVLELRPGNIISHNKHMYNLNSPFHSYSKSLV